MTYPALHILGYLYWILLLLVTAASLVFAVLAFRLHKRVFTIISAGALAAALFIAAAPAPKGDTGLEVLLGMLALALGVIGGGPVAVLTLQLATQGTVAPGNHGGIMVESDTAENEAAGATGTRPMPVHEVLRGGLTIGILERLAVAGSILAGFPEAIAVVVAIKGVGRFTELAASEARERFIIGTLASLIWASACAALVLVVSG